jgi:outer membrane protein TolC
MSLKTLLLSSFCAISLSFSACAEDKFLADPLKVQDEIKSKDLNKTCFNVLPIVSKQLILKDLVNIALCNNPTTRGAWSKVLASAAAVGSSRSAYFPTIDGEINEGRTLTHEYRNTSLDNANSKRLIGETLFNPSITLNYLLYDFGGREAQLEANKQNLLASDYTFNATIQKVIFNVVKSYYGYIASKAAVIAARESLNAAELSKDAAATRYSIGNAALVDKLQAETAYSQAKLVETQALNQREVSKGALLNSIGLDPDYEIQLSESNLDIGRKDDEFSLNVSDMIKFAKENRPDLMAADRLVQSNRSAIDVAKAANYPSISLNASQQYYHYNPTGGINQNSSTIALTVAVPIFTGFNNTYKIAAARENYNVELANRDSIENNLSQDVWRTYHDFKTAEQNLVTTQELIISAEQADKVALGRYKAGVGSMIDLLTAQAQLARARQERILAQYNWLTIRFDLIRALGSLTIEKIGND